MFQKRVVILHYFMSRQLQSWSQCMKIRLLPHI